MELSALILKDGNQEARDALTNVLVSFRRESASILYRRGISSSFPVCQHKVLNLLEETRVIGGFETFVRHCFWCYHIQHFELIEGVGWHDEIIAAQLKFRKVAEKIYSQATYSCTCGSDDPKSVAVRFKDYPPDWYWVLECSCGLHTQGWPHLKSAQSMWNTRCLNDDDIIERRYNLPQDMMLGVRLK